jgi:hypothetical protein
LITHMPTFAKTTKENLMTLVESGGEPSSDVPQHDGTLLASLAILSVNASEDKRSYLDHFVPFAVEALATGCGGSGTDTQVAESLKNLFGLVIPIPVVRDILKRSERQRGISLSNNTFTIPSDIDRERTKFQVVRSRVMRHQADLVEQLMTFSQEKFQLGWTKEVAEAALQQFVGEMSVPLMRSVLNGGTSPDHILPSAASTAEIFIVSEFVAMVLHQDQAAFECLESLVKGSMLASALYLPGTPAPTRKFRDTTLWIDTPIALRWLGLQGGEAQSYVAAVLDLAVQQGARLGIFTHTLREIRGVVRSAADSIHSISGVGRPGAVAMYFRDTGVTFSEAHSIAADLEAQLTDLGAVIEDAPEHSLRFGVDENLLESILHQIVHPNSQGALIYDLKSLTAIYRLRKDNAGDSIEDCRALLLTNNSSLVHAAIKFFGRNSSQLPIAALDHEVASLLWSKRPMDAPELPRNRMIADALAALQPSPELWTAYDRELEHLFARDPSKQDVALVLRHGTEARRFLMRETHADPARVTPEVVDAIYKDLMETGAAPVRAQLDQTEVERDAGLVENDDLRKRLAAMEERDTRIKEQEIADSKRRARLVGTTIRVITVGLYGCFVLGYIPVAWATYLFPSHGFRTLIGDAGGAFTLISGFISVRGRSFFKLADVCEIRTQKRFQKRAFRRIGAEDRIGQ